MPTTPRTAGPTDVKGHGYADILGWAEEKKWLDRLADQAVREGYEPSPTLEEMAREVAQGQE